MPELPVSMIYKMIINTDVSLEIQTNIPKD